MYIHIYICIYVYIYVSAYVYVYVYLYMYLSMYIHIYIYIHPLLFRLSENMQISQASRYGCLEFEIHSAPLWRVGIARHDPPGNDTSVFGSTEIAKNNLRQVNSMNHIE